MLKYKKMVALNKEASEAKIELARKTIWQMVEESERFTVPKLMERTGLSRGFFYKNPSVRRELDRAMEQQGGMPEPRRGILDLAMHSELELLQKQLTELFCPFCRPFPFCFWRPIPLPEARSVCTTGSPIQGSIKATWKAMSRARA